MAVAGLISSVPAVKITDDDLLSEDEGPIMAHIDSSLLLADALRKVDGLIGDFKPEPPCAAANDPVVKAIMDCCDRLYHLIRQWNSEHSSSSGAGATTSSSSSSSGGQEAGPWGGGGEGEEEVHASGCVPSDVRQLIVSWLSNRRMESAVVVDQLRRDKEELLNRVVSLQQQQEAATADNQRLCKKVEELERSCVEKDQHNRSLAEELKSTKAALHSKEVEVRHLKDELQASKRGGSPLTSNHAGKSVDRLKHVTLIAPNGNIEGGDKREGGPKRSSFRISLKKAFSRKKGPVAAVHDPAPASPTKPLNPRAAEFHAKGGKQLAEWFATVGLDMYTDLVERNLSSGEQLVTMVTTNNNTLLAQIGIVSTLHCKKLRLAVEDAVSEIASPLRGLDHLWVAEWLKDIGLPQYQRKFLDARIDCTMLNVVTMENLNLLDIDSPFHIASLKRAIQALRMCGYQGDYLKEAPPGQSSKKLLHWSARDVVNWIRTIELDDYASGLEETGIHGALMLLDVHFTSESLAIALGITPSMGLIRGHLSRRFMELIGPVAAQKKYDAMQSKNFVALDPSETGRVGHRQRSRSTGSRRGRNQEGAQENLLCPLDQFPPTFKGVDPSSPPPLIGSPNHIQPSTP